MNVAISIFIAVIGLVIGSFLNVVVMRLHAGQQFVKGRSECDHCHKPLLWWELIPLVSWLALRGRCSKCKKPISAQHPAVEAITAVLFIAAFLTHPMVTFADLVVLLLWLYVLGSFIVLAVYDIRWYLLPDKVLLPLIIPAIAILIGRALPHQEWQILIGPVAAAFVFGGGFYLLAAVSKGKWMGGGDIKLAFVMGLLLGLQRTALAMFIAFVSAAFIGSGLILTKRKSRRDLIPFGPFLIAGTLVAYLWGSELIRWYMQVSGLNLL